MYPKVNPKQRFPELEAKILAFWKENKTFQKSLDIRRGNEEFVFFDGPPFASGLPHYGHLLGGTLKDIIPRYQTMKGKYVERRFGWDCHGLPIENIVEKKLGISGKHDIEDKIGVFEFNEACRNNVMTYTQEWRKIVEKMGRWVDMDNDYKTMDTNFMESIWWVFKSLYDKDYVYESHRVIPYCPRCSTPLSNFEINQGYEDKQDKSITVKFKVKDSANKYILAWTTTPWTLPANLGLAVGKDIDYSEVLDKATGETYILAKDRVNSYYKSENDYIIIRTYKGECLVGIKYESMFNDFELTLESGELPLGLELGQNVYSVVLGHHVTTESGTGIVHIAPAYGLDDAEIGKKEKLGFVAHIDDTGNVENLIEYNGEYVFDFNETVIKLLKDRGTIINISTINHSYPHCYRCHTPLIYRGISAWYIKVEESADKLVKNNQEINWVPDNIKEGRFGKWIEQARDWNVSRNRYWGSAMPIWKSEDKSEQLCIGSIQELYELNKDFGQIEKRGEKYYYTEFNLEVDLHKHYVDKIKVKNPKTGTTMTRIPEVLDCWFESGSMPYASKHYPFADKENIKYPGEFIAEGQDQTRGWFYTLLVLGTLLYDRTPFLNVIVNGMVLAEDGKKMSKSLDNYPDPVTLINKHGADAIRFYMMNSGAVRAEDMKFMESGVEETIKKVLLPLWNTYSFFTTYANIDNFKPDVGNIYFVRHGETDNNKNGIVNGGNDEGDLNELGIEQSIELGKKLAQSDIKFDYIITSPMVRAKHSASLINKELGYEVEIIEDETFREQSYGEFVGMSADEICAKYNVDYSGRIYRNNSVEPLEEFMTRIEKGYNDLKQKYAGKNILLISHGGVYRVINKLLNTLSIEESFYQLKMVPSAVIIKLPNYIKENNLDKWVYSELQKLISDVSNGFEKYDLNAVTRPIVDFMDNLTNWYIRRSRRRFWKSENDGDKLQAYNTLYEVLVEVSKVIAPIIPFISEEIFKNLTNKESVHLEFFSTVNQTLILNELSESMSRTQKIINLGLSLRGSKKLRVRQPLQSITIGEKLTEYYQEIIKEELNVKEIIVLDDMSQISLKICKPNARLIGPRFGASVQEIIKEAKTGNFSELESGKIKVGSFELNEGEYEIAYEAKEGINADIQAGFGMVIAMNTVISEELKLEGYARDIVRAIQDARKEAGYNVSDRVNISFSGEIIDSIINSFKDYIEGETLSLIINKFPDSDISKEVDLEDFKISFELKK